MEGRPPEKINELISNVTDTVSETLVLQNKMLEYLLQKCQKHIGVLQVFPHLKLENNIK